MNCIPCDFLSNEKYTYTKKEYEKAISVLYLIKNSYNSEKISNTWIDDAYHTALNNGASGGKILGSGNGGFFLFFEHQ